MAWVTSRAPSTLTAEDPTTEPEEGALPQGWGKDETRCEDSAPRIQGRREGKAGEGDGVRERVLCLPRRAQSSESRIEV